MSEGYDYALGAACGGIHGAVPPGVHARRGGRDHAGGAAGDAPGAKLAKVGPPVAVE